MPLYEYECDACGKRFERIQKFSDPSPDKCPSCGGSVRRLLSSPAIQFKGSGFYITDYPKKSGEKGGGGGDEKTPKSTESATESKAGETKPSTSSESSTPAPSTTPKETKS